MSIRENASGKIHLLILGAPRSGTTLLTSMIGRHCEVGILVEDMGNAFARVAGKQVVGNKLCIPNHVELHRRRNLARRTGVEKLLRKSGVVALWKRFGILEEFYYGSVFSIEDYFRLENFRTVLINRHPDRVIASIHRRGGKSESKATARWCRAVEIMDTLQARMGGDALVVTFEDLLQKPEAHMRRIATFLELDYDPRMLEGAQFNLLYPDQTSIDQAKAEDSDGEHYHIRENRPDIWSSYLRLREMGTLSP